MRFVEPRLNFSMLALRLFKLPVSLLGPRPQGFHFTRGGQRIVQLNLERAQLRVPVGDLRIERREGLGQRRRHELTGESCLDNAGTYECQSGCADADSDGYADDSCGGTDCDDANAAVNPGETEVCDLVDNNCDTVIDEGFDADSDTYSTCASPVADCNDADADINPGATELCDEVDNNCDTVVDEGFDAYLNVNVHVGTVLAGDFGPPGGERFDVVGKTVNIAARLGRRGMTLSPQAFRCLSPEGRKRFEKVTRPVTYQFRF